MWCLCAALPLRSLSSPLRPLVIIPTAGGGPLHATLAACAGWPMLVVDDSADGLIHQQHPELRWLRTPGRQGFARACNEGLAWAESNGHPLALLLNDDAAPAPGCIAALSSAWTDADGALGPVLIDPKGQVEGAGMTVAWWGRVRAVRRAPPGPAHVDALSGACMLVASRCRLDPAYAHGFEDVALCLQLRRAGRAVRIIPDARCHHAGGATVHRRSADAQRHAVSGHLRLVGGGWRSVPVLGLAAAQVVREGGSTLRFHAIADGWRDWRQAALKPDR